jgi:hypothetical protein
MSHQPTTEKGKHVGADFKNKGSGPGTMVGTIGNKMAVCLDWRNIGFGVTPSVLKKKHVNLVFQKVKYS